jgi:hypothetical protein
MKNLKIENNKMILSFDVSKVKKPLQRVYLRDLLRNNAITEAFKYLETFQGERRNSIYKKSFSQHQELYHKNRILDLFYASLKNRGASHRPLSHSASDFIGVEIECLIPRFEHSNGDTIESDDQNMNELSDFFKIRKIKNVSIGGDGSIQEIDGFFACEIRVLTRLSHIDNLEKTCKLLNDLGAKVNKSCGLHVHLDARHLSQDQVSIIGKNFSKAMPTLASLMPKSRLDNRFCKLGVSKFNGSRYYAVNLTAFSKYKTIEVRLHSSTTDFVKIKNWIDLLSAIKQSTIKKTCKDLNQLTDYVLISEDLLEYFTQRQALFNPDLTQGLVSDSFRDLDQAA